MDTMNLLAQFADPETIKTLSANQRLMAGLITTFLGMGITIISLVILQFVIGLMEKFAAPKVSAQEDIATVPASTLVGAEKEEHTGEEQLVAAITVALAVQLKTVASNIVIRNIRKVEDHSPAWNKVGITEQMNNNA